MKITHFLLSCAVITSFAFAGKHHDHKNGDRLHYIKFKAKTVEERSRIANFVHIDDIIEDNVYSTVTEADLKAAKKNLSDLIVETHNLKNFSRATNLNLREEYEFPSGDEAFHTYDEVMAEMVYLAEQYPHIAEVFTLGDTYEGRQIPTLRITEYQNRYQEWFTPGIYMVGSHHAREHLSTEIPLMMARYLLENYDRDPEIKRLIDYREIYITPLLNADGKLHDIKGRNYKMWRKNRAINAGSNHVGVDLNRNYSFGWGTGGSSKSPSSDVFMGPAPFSEPETLAVKKFIEQTPNIMTLISFHTFSELILYPWGGRHEGVGGVDQQIFEKMAGDMSQWNGYKPQQSSDLYIASGDTCDWAYGEHNIYCFTFELSPRSMWSGGFYPGASKIMPTFEANINPILYMIEYTDDPSRVLDL